MHVAIVFEREEAPVKHAVERRCEHQSVEWVQSLLILRASVPWANVAGDEEPLIFHASDAASRFDHEDVSAEAALSDARGNESLAGRFLDGRSVDGASDRLFRLLALDFRV